ncbi:MAG: hypothetical protein R2748_31155 [Bryobacterales bacterium]
MVGISSVSTASITLGIDVPKNGKGARTWDVRVTNPGGNAGVRLRLYLFGTAIAPSPVYAAIRITVPFWNEIPL